MINQNKRWLIPEEKSEINKELAGILNISDVLAELLIQRGYEDIKKATDFLHPENQEFCDPLLLKGMEESVTRIETALLNKEKIVVYGDYDVDGMSATALTVRVLRALSAQVSFYIPERQSEGYGINLEALNKFIKDDVDLLITVDCGISSIAEIELVKNKIDIIITDHHRPPDTLPPAFAIINPHQEGCIYPEKNLAGVGVAFKLCQALWSRIKQETLTDFIDLAMLGTIADLMPLVGENRLIVALGMKQLNDTKNLGLKALLKNCNPDHRVLNTATIGFGIAPRLNAAGRLSSALSAVELLLTDDEEIAAKIAGELENENHMRRMIQDEVIEEAEKYIATIDIKNEKVLVIVGDHWNSGVIGLAASKILDKYYKPTIVISVADGIGKASCRSIQGFNIHSALTECADLLIKYGGHEAAAGFSLCIEKIATLREKLNEIAKRDLVEADYIPEIKIDKKISLSDITENLIDELKLLEPCGMGNIKPTFVACDYTVESAFLLGAEKKHLKLNLRHGVARKECVFWNRGDLIDFLLPESKVDIVFKPVLNEWQGRKNIQLVIEDIRDSETQTTRLDELFLIGNQRERYVDIGLANQFFTKLVGVTFDNRQETISHLQQGDELIWERQPDNPFDVNAILVKDLNQNEIGYLKADLAKFLAKEIDENLVQYKITVMEVTGRENQSYGVNVLVSKIFQTADDIDPRHLKKNFTVAEIKQAIIGTYQYHEKQLETLTSLKNGNNTLTIMGTGRGKSAIFQTYAVNLALKEKMMTIVVYPLRALVNDQYLNMCDKMSDFCLGIYKGNGTLSSQERADLFTALQLGQVDILLTTPEFLLAHLDSIVHSNKKIGFFVIDECHHIGDGQKRSGYQSLDEMIKRFKNPRVLAVTATADNKTVNVIQQTIEIKNIIIDKTVRENLYISDMRNTTDKLAELKNTINEQDRTLIFVNSRTKAVEIASQLREGLIGLKDKIAFYHAGLSNEWRMQIENWFRDGEINVVVATSAFGEGIDLPDIRHVVLYHLPFDMVSFNQQCGRAGRDGKRSMIHLLYGKNDISLNELILKEKAPQRELIGKVYLILKSLLQGETPIICTNENLVEQMNLRYREFVSADGIGICLRILEELGLIWRETIGNKRKIFFNVQLNKKLNLDYSSTFCEGSNIRNAFAAFSTMAMSASANKLLNYINRPIYPIDTDLK